MRTPQTYQASDKFFMRTRRMHWTLAGLAFAILPHMLHLPLWISALALAAGAWRFTAHHQRWNLPPAVLRLVLAVISFCLVIVEYGTINGVEAGSALLVVMTAMKLTETRVPRDYAVLLFIAYFLVIAQFLHSQTVWVAVWAIPALWVISTALLQVSHKTAPMPIGKALRTGGTLLVQALPLMLLLFLLFPRVPGPFWALPSSGSSGTTGLSEEMEPGSIAQLTRSDEVAFRVNFESAIPERAELYWRGPVLHEFDGRKWTAGLLRQQGYTARQVEYSGTPSVYEITLEPHQQHWLLALDIPDTRTLPFAAMLTLDYQAVLKERVTQVQRHKLVSYPQAGAFDLPPLASFSALQMPKNTVNPRARALAERWRGRHNEDDLAIVQAALRMFQQQPFHYTLSPPALGASPVDDFLFETRSGFCEHYSSAFTLLMRAAGVPARVVTGYLGGEVNPFGGHLTVRQSDAHAWTEVWLEGRGWTRVDPTGAVAPDRIEFGLAEAIEETEPVAGALMRGNRFLSRVRFGWDAANNTWNDWILGYGKEKQMALLERLGMKAPNAMKMTIALTALLIVFAVLLSLWLAWRSRPRPPDAAARIYEKFCAKLSRRNISRAQHEGPGDFAARVAGERPELAAQVGLITGLYVRLRYQPWHGPRDVQRLRHLVKAFRP